MASTIITETSTSAAGRSSTTTSNISSTTPLRPPPRSSLRKTASSSQPPSLRKLSTAASTPNLNAAYTSQSRLAPGPPPDLRLSRKTSLAALPTRPSLASIPDVAEDYDASSVLSAAPISRSTMAPTTPGRPTFDDVFVGDAVEVPGNMHGIVRFVGSVQGKKGTFAGVELDADFASRGKNSGDVDGVSYFSTSIPGAGIFLPVSKAVRRESLPAFPMSPGTSGLRAGSQNTASFTPPTPGVPKFSASIGPGARAPSPQGKRPGTGGGRTSLPRPDSPVRRSQATPGPRPSIGTPAKGPSRYGSPTTNRFAQSVRGTAAESNKRALERKPSLPARSASALGFDDDATPVGPSRSKTNGSVGSVASFRRENRSPSRMAASNDDEAARLRAQLEDRDRQLKEQSATLAEMESSLSELQSLMETAGDPRAVNNPEAEGKDTTQLRGLLREKSEKIAMLTAEFDAHRADFRSTIDALEMASTETERVYERRIEELMADVRELESRNLDVDSVASQLKQLEELVQELEEGLEDARRGEAEARGEVEFLRGEVERTRTELLREREKGGSGQFSPPHKELEQKEDEIRGLKAIIHSLSRDSVPGNAGHTRASMSGPRRGSLINNDVIEHKIARDNLERQVAELQSILEKRTSHEEELEQEVERLRSANGGASNGSANANGRRSSLRDSRDTVVMARDTRSPEVVHKRGATLDTMAESDAQSSATENSTLWCEICETSGHDILTCTNMFGPEGAKAQSEAKQTHPRDQLRPPMDDGAHPAPLSPVKSKSPLATPTVKILPNPMESGPVAGKESGVVDTDKWCAVCERDGHDSVDCPFEDAF